MNVLIVPQDDINKVFPIVRDYLDKAAKLSGGRYTIEEVYENVRFNNQQLWIAFNDTEIVASAVTELISYSKIKTLVGHFIGGKDLESWKQPIVDALAKFAKAEGCDRIEFMGRRGWGKPLKKIGWQESYRVYEYFLEK